MAKRSGIPVLLLSGTLLSACTALDNPIGPDPVIQAADAARSSDNYLNVRDIFIRRAGYPTTAAYVDWYEVAVAGFGYVDEQCAAYLDGLYRVRRERDHIKSQLTSIGGTTNSILGVADASKAAIAITAAAFGLGSQITDNASAAVLYSMDPADIDVLLKNQMQAYRNGVALQRSNYSSSSTAMEAVRGYLNLCLPVAIEAQIKAAIQNTVYVAVASPSGVPTLERVQTASQPRLADVRTGTDNVRPAPQPVAANLLPGDIPSLTPEQVKIVQRRLCVAVDGDLGGPASDTRKALGILQGRMASFSTPTLRLDPGTLRAAVELPDCDPARRADTYEQVHLRNEAEIKALQERLRMYINRTSHEYINNDTKIIVNKESFVSGDRLNDQNRYIINIIQKINGKEETGKYSEEVALAITR
ncbi:hypothetical protein [Prosthecomicrobium pneumaticum]|uniref:Uncharacterized protein n=1 Tax=Prosthecomicrobium pneumaticum TaxID=81895 RepID=A0A7W9CV71_9HYPH|nr:hypothetical protein [Prosthecomicrobium pneumaticum]MBB5752176.1 hypothetical protein [Prosthecomicrobium pneumaticum]